MDGGAMEWCSDRTEVKTRVRKAHIGMGKEGD